MSESLWDVISREQSTDGAEAQRVGALADTAYWEQAAACSQIFAIIAPHMEAQGIDPLDICR